MATTPRQPPKPQGKPATNGAARPAAPAARPAAPAARPAPTAARPQAARPAATPARPAATPTRPAAPAAQPTRPAAVRPQPQYVQKAAAPPPPPPADEPAEIYPDNPHEGEQSEPYYGEPAADDQGGTYEAEQPAPEPARPAAPRPVAPRPQPAARPAAKPAAQPRSQALAVPSETGLVGVTDGVRYDMLPDYMREDLHKGKENIQSEDLGIVQYKLMQATSPELQEREDLRAGDFLHTGSGRNLGPEWYCVFIHFQRQFILWNPLEAGGGILARAADGIHWDPPNSEWTVNLDKKDGGHAVTWRTARTVKESGLHLWGSMNPDDTTSPPAATKMLSFLALPWQYMEDGPAILTFQRSSLKKGSQLLSKIKMQRAPMFGVVYKIMSVTDTNRNNQSFMNMKVEAMGMVQDQDLYEQFKSLNLSFAESGLNIRDIDDLQHEHIPDDQGGAGDDDVEDAQYEGAPAY